jgi:hypothetical protein
LDGDALGVVEGEDVVLHGVDNGRLISLTPQVFPSVFVSITSPSSSANDTVAPDNLHKQTGLVLQSLFLISKDFNEEELAKSTCHQGLGSPPAVCAPVASFPSIAFEAGVRVEDWLAAPSNATLTSSDEKALTSNTLKMLLLAVSILTDLTSG